MKKMEIIRAVVEMTGLKILNSKDSFRLIEKVVKCKKQSKYGEEQEPTDLVDKESEEVTKLYKKASKPAIKQKRKYSKRLEGGVDKYHQAAEYVREGDNRAQALAKVGIDHCGSSYKKLDKILDKENITFSNKQGYGKLKVEKVEKYSAFQRRKNKEISKKFQQAIEYVRAGASRAKAFDKVGMDKCGTNYRRLGKMLDKENITFSNEMGKGERHKKGKENVAHTLEDGRILRMRYINSRVNYLQRSLNISREEALSRASDEYVNYKHEKHKSAILKEEIVIGRAHKKPLVYEDDRRNNLTLDMIKYIAENNENEITYWGNSGTLGEAQYGWNVVMSRIISLSDEICKYLKVPNKLHLGISGGYKFISYK